MTPVVDFKFTPETFAIAAHSGQKYGDQLYSYHLQQVVATTKRYTDIGELINGAWLHDVVEDTSVTYYDLCTRFGQPTANVVWACTGVGRSRKEKQAHILSKLPGVPGAPLVKLADRIENIKASIREDRKDKFIMYSNEHAAFSAVVAPLVPVDMYAEYLDLITEGRSKYDHK